MNHEGEQGVEDVVFDRLVDGELSAQEYRTVVRSMEARPADWRRCALAFLESQAWKGELKGWQSDAHESDADERTNSRADRGFQWSWTWGGLMTLASAASFLLAFFLAAQVFQSSALESRPDVAKIDGQAPSEGIAATGRLAPDRPWGKYRLVLDGDDGQSKQIEMPIYSNDDPRARWLFNEQATMPVELIRELKRMGFEVDRQRKWTPVVENADGPVLVPIEELRITPVSSRSYQ